jgi:hypothetical protein
MRWRDANRTILFAGIGTAPDRRSGRWSAQEMADVVAVAHEEARRDDASDDRPIWSSPDTSANVAFANHLDTY